MNITSLMKAEDVCLDWCQKFEKHNTSQVSLETGRPWNTHRCIGWQPGKSTWLIKIYLQLSSLVLRQQIPCQTEFAYPPGTLLVSSDVIFPGWTKKASNQTPISSSTYWEANPQSMSIVFVANVFHQDANSQEPTAPVNQNNKDHSPANNRKLWLLPWKRKIQSNNIFC